MGGTHHDGEALVDLLREADLLSPVGEDEDHLVRLLGAEPAELAKIFRTWITQVPHLETAAGAGNTCQLPPSLSLSLSR